MTRALELIGREGGCNLVEEAKTPRWKNWHQVQPRKIHLSPLASTSSTAKHSKYKQHSSSLERGRGVTGECTVEPWDTPMKHKIPIAGKNKYLFYLKSFLTMSPSTRCWWAWGHRHVSLSVALGGIATSRFAKYQQYTTSVNLTSSWNIVATLPDPMYGGMGGQ